MGTSSQNLTTDTRLAQGRVVRFPPRQSGRGLILSRGKEE